MAKKKKEIRFECFKCTRDFKTQGALTRHDNKEHPYIPTPPPKKTTEVSSGQWETRTLLGGKRKLTLGDVFYRIEKCVIKRLTVTEGSDDIEVGYEITRQHYQVNKPE